MMKQAFVECLTRVSDIMGRFTRSMWFCLAPTESL